MGSSAVTRKYFFRRVRRCPKQLGVSARSLNFSDLESGGTIEYYLCTIEYYLCNKIKAPHRRLYPTERGGRPQPLEGVQHIVEFTGLRVAQ